MSALEYSLSIYDDGLVDVAMPAGLSKDHRRSLASVLEMCARDLSDGEDLKTSKTRRAILDAANGIYYGYPICCIIRYAMTAWLQPDARQGTRRGGIYPNRHHQWVPCGIFHRSVESQT